MTREEQIIYVKNLRTALNMANNFSAETMEALDEAIKALEQEPCEDTISRQAVLDNAYAYGNGLEPEGYCVNIEDIQALPPVTPTRKKGKWIVEIWNNREHHTCSACKKVVDYEPCYHYCPYCGAEMEGEE